MSRSKSNITTNILSMKAILEVNACKRYNGKAFIKKKEV